MASKLLSFFRELKRRKVWQVAAAYLAAVVAISFGVPDLFGAFGAPSWAAPLVIALLVIGFPVAIILAWAVELTPEGIRRTDAPKTSPHAGRGEGVEENSEPQGLAGHQNPAGTALRSVAVLPFNNLSPTPDHAYFADGVTEDVLAHLAKVKALQVTSRTSVMRYRETRKSVGEIATELGVQTVLEGSVRATPDRVRVVAQLIDASTDTHLWAETYDRDLEDIFAVQSEVAESVARALAAELSGKELDEIHQPPTDDVAAYSLCLEGMAAFRADEPEDWTRALGLFETALRIDPDYARAHAGLALTLIWYPWVTHRMPARYGERLKASVRRALELDPSLAHARLARSVYLWSYERDWLGAEDELRRAEELDPDDPFVLQSRAFFTYMLGRFQESEAYLDRMKALGHHSLLAEIYRGCVETYRAAYGEFGLDVPIRRFDALASLYPDYGMVCLYRAIPLMFAKRYEEALTDIEKGLLSAPQAPFGHGMRGAILAELGRTEEALAEDEWFKKAPGVELADRFSWALIHLGLQDVDRGFDLLEEGTRSHTSILLPFIRMAPAYQPLWDHPRFLALMDAVWPGDQKQVLGEHGWRPGEGAGEASA